MQPHAFQPTAAGSSLCGYPGCLSPRMALIHAVGDVPDPEPVPREHLIGPFPQEPALGSPAAVEQAAGTIRRYAGATMDDPAGPLVRHEDYLALEEVAEQLRDKVENLQDRIEDRRDSENYWKAAAEKALADLDRQHALAAEGSKQRDALAEALEAEVAARRWRPISEWGQVPIGRIHEVGEEQRGIVWSRGIAAPPEVPSHRFTHFRECLNGEPEQAVAALRKAGR